MAAAPFGREALEEGRPLTKYDGIDAGDGPWISGNSHLGDLDEQPSGSYCAKLGDPSDAPPSTTAP